MTGRASQSIVMTGASTGIGRAATLALLAEGFEVFAGVRDEKAAAGLRELAAPGTRDRLHTLELDVTNAEQIHAAAARVAAVVGERGLWGLFNNAGIVVSGPLETLPIDALRRELRPWGINVSLLEPGGIATDIWGKGASEFDEVLKAPPPGLVKRYGGLVAALHKAAAESAAKASPTSVVDRAVVHAFTAARPRTRYRMGKDSTSRKVLAMFPDRWVDALVAKVFGWG